MDLLRLISNRNRFLKSLQIENEKNESAESKELLLLLSHHNKNIKLEDVKNLVERGANVNIRNGLGMTPLYFMCYKHTNFKEEMKIAKYLIDHGANVNNEDRDRITPLLYATDHNYDNFELIKLLVERGADVNHKDRSGMTALMKAVCHPQYLYIIKYLIEKGADINTRNIYDESAVNIAIDYVRFQKKKEYLKVVKILLENGGYWQISKSDYLSPEEDMRRRIFNVYGRDC